MDLTLAKEFVGASEAEAVEKAAKFFGVSAAQLELRTLPSDLGVAGLGSRVVVLASTKDEPVELGPVGEFISGVLERMQVSGRAGLEEVEAEGEVVITLRSQGLREWARQDSRVLGALSHLAQRVAQKRMGEDASARVELPGGEQETRGDRQERGVRRDRGDRAARPGRGNRGESDDTALEKLAHESAAEVTRTGRAVLLRPMNSKERWLIHNVVNETPGLRSESEGEGRMRRVKIEPE